MSDEWAGAENVVYHLGKELDNKLDINLNILTTEELIPYYFNLKNINLINLGHLGSNKLSRIINYFNLRKNLKKFLKIEKNDLIVLFLEYSYVLFFNMYSENKSVISTFRGSEIQDILDKKFNPYSFFVKDGISNGKKIISVSNNLIKNLPEKYKKKTVVIPNGVDSRVFKPLNNIKKKKNVVLFVGRITQDKGINEILSVAKQLPQYEFWFAGKGDLSKKINLSNTKYLGEKNSEELVKLYNKATICILPSYHEGFSNVGLETIACGRSLICTPDFSEYIENGKDGIIIPAKDEKALKDAIIDLMTNEKKRKMLEKNARKKALQYSWDNVAKQYMKVFKEVLKDNRGQI